MSNSSFSSWEDVCDNKKQIDTRLVDILKSKIKDKPSMKKPMPAAPDDFPFAIEDNPSEKCMNLTRKLDGEKIDVKVELFKDWSDRTSKLHEDEEEYWSDEDEDWSDEDDDDSDDDEDDDDDHENLQIEYSKDKNGLITVTKKRDGEIIDVWTEPDDIGDSDYSDVGNSDYSDSDGNLGIDVRRTESNDDDGDVLNLEIKITKQNGALMNIEVEVCFSADMFRIREMTLSDPSGHPFLQLQPFKPRSDSQLQLDTNMHDLLTEFLHVRGIKDSYLGFIREYISQKSKQSKQYNMFNKLDKFFKD